MDIHSILKKYWGYDTFRPLQEDIITSVIEGNDTLVLLATGGGKSLCYQIPAIAMEGICLVVSPLIALMKDQVQNLNQRGIKSACLVSGMNRYEQEIVLNKCITNRIQILYVSPERLKQRTFIEHFRQMNINLIAVDEAHCISQWGYDFRPSYLEIANIRKYHPSIPILALTASATPNVVEDIQKQLLFTERHQIFKSSFKRENLSYMVFKENDKEGRLMRILKTIKGPSIVYVRNRRNAQRLASLLCSQGISALYYHAGLSTKQRDLNQSEWMNERYQVIVATNAFGMGIDKANVRTVIHLDIPSSPEAYFQEAGRAGRDGQRSYAVLLYNQADIEQLNSKVLLSYPPIKQIQTIYRAIGNYYQIPIGSGDGCSFDLELDKLCETYGFNINECFNALRLLENEGLIAIPNREESESQICILISREEVYRFQMENRKYGDLLTILLRMYGGLFVDFVPIHENKIASKYPLADEAKIIRMLQHLDALKIISYKKKSEHPQITFTSDRIDSQNLSLSREIYDQQKENAQSRIDAMLKYVNLTSGCRSQFLLDYFGEYNSSECRECDLCIIKNKTKKLDLTQQIKQILNKAPLNIKMLIEELQKQNTDNDNINLDESKIVAQIRQLVDNGEIRLSSDFLLHYTNEK